MLFDGKGLSIESLADGLTPEQLVDRIFGGRLEISSLTYSGAQIAAGTFSGGSGTLGLGVVLSSGAIDHAGSSSWRCQRRRCMARVRSATRSSR